MNPVMNDTKWDELRLSMYGLGALSPQWHTKDLESGYLSDWDREWFYRFRDVGYSSIEWVEIKVESSQQDAAVLAVLHSIHVPGHRTDLGFKVFGYVDGPVEYFVPSRIEETCRDNGLEPPIICTPEELMGFTDGN